MVNTQRANARPRKDFFVSMLTRDITLEDCILDLIDNAVDAAWTASGQKPKTLVVDNALSAYDVRVEMSANAFTIADNCTGINLDDAVNYAFTFGRVRGDEPDKYTVGVYGIGMKRAIFKIGKQISIQSTYEEPDGTLVGFEVPINVDTWLGDDGPLAGADEQSAPVWDFDIEPLDPAANVGVVIQVTDLLPDTSELFADKMHERALRRLLAKDYMLPLMRGLNIWLNGTQIEPTVIELRQNESFAPMRHRYEDGDVEVELLAGMAFQPSDDIDPDTRKDEVSGWYVACNGRMMLTADRSSVTGWGELLPSWHRQYGGFVGLIFFSAENPLLLPMTTTKRSVDTSSAVYRRALGRMIEPTRAWINYTNARKSDLRNLKDLEKTAASTAITSVPERETVSLPTVTKNPAAEPMANVNYAVPRRRIRALGEALGDRRMSYRDVGLESFEYAYGELVDEENE